MNTTCEYTDKTKHAPPHRSSDSEIAAKNAVFQAETKLNDLLDSMPQMVLIINSNRQIVSANQRVIESLGINIQHMMGKRPGEIIQCIHSEEGPGGCGTGLHCKVCGAVNTILQSQTENRYYSGECRITTAQGTAFDWKVTASPIMISYEQLYCITIEDVSNTKRRQALERTFFHDVINMVGAMSGLSDIVAEEYNQDDRIKHIAQLSSELLEEIETQKALSMAENGDLEPNPESFQLKPFIDQTAEFYKNHPASENCQIIVNCQPAELFSDKRLLRRALINMIKNAIEASKKGETVEVVSKNSDTEISISVFNPAVMTEDVKLQVFKRSFSTKEGLGRGLGTYSIKLLGEKYLGGKVSFISEEPKGTIFSITLPRDNSSLN